MYGGSSAFANGSKNRLHDFRESIAEFRMLLCVEMHAIDGTARRDASRVKEMASETGRSLEIGCRQTERSLLGLSKFRRNASARRANLRRANHQHRRHG